MNERPQFFKAFAEIDARPDFDPACGITPETVVALIGEYHCENDEERPCQRLKSDGTLCGEDHKNGWLGKHGNGKEALIGSNCGKDHFHASAVFSRERNRIHTELKLDGLVDRLTRTAGSEEYKRDARATLERARALLAATKEVKARFPKALGARLEDMEKRGDPGVYVQYRYEKLDEDDELVADWTRTRVATVAGLKTWNPLPLQAAFTSLHAIRDAIAEVVIHRELGDRKLKAWADTLDELPRCVEVLADLEAALAAFQTPDNVRWLPFVVRSHIEGLQAARVALEFAGDPNAAQNSLRLFNELSDQLRRGADGRDFRVTD